MSSSSSGPPRVPQDVPKRGRGRPRLRREIRIESQRRLKPDYRKLTRALVGALQVEALSALAAATRHQAETDDAPVGPREAHTATAPSPSAPPAQRAQSAPHTGAEGHDG